MKHHLKISEGTYMTLEDGQQIPLFVWLDRPVGETVVREDIIFFQHNTYQIRPSLWPDIFIGTWIAPKDQNVDEYVVEHAFLKVRDDDYTFDVKQPFVYQCVTSFDCIT